MAIIPFVNPGRARIHRHWALFMGVYYVSLVYAESWFGMDLVVMAPLNLSLSGVIAALATQMAARVKS